MFTSASQSYTYLTKTTNSKADLNKQKKTHLQYYPRDEIKLHNLHRSTITMMKMHEKQSELNATSKPTISKIQTKIKRTATQKHTVRKYFPLNI